ncbi:MAG TPA: DUF692 domain-containing protein [Afifellaceae bacterium]|nr:DUF692 domain-containing protein [Afifellaceae bacterium]
MTENVERPMSDGLGPEIRPIPARVGVGLKADHYREILETGPDIGWFEVHPENYMCAGGPPHAWLTRIRELYPLSLHGVGLSIGAEKPLDTDHLARLKNLVDRYQPGLVSEHLAWSTHDTTFLNDLLPLPYTEETLARVARHVGQVQDALGRQILIENPSTYVVFETSTMTETDFMKGVAERSGCGLLLDVNNVFVSATNHGFSPEFYIDTFPVGHVGEIHLGGHAEDEDEAGYPLLIDAHDRAVIDPVWQLYHRALKRCGVTPTLIEWDNDVPEWPVLFSEAQQAEAIIDRVRAEPSHAAA